MRCMSAWVPILETFALAFPLMIDRRAMLLVMEKVRQSKNDGILAQHPK